MPDEAAPIVAHVLRKHLEQSSRNGGTVSSLLSDLLLSLEAAPTVSRISVDGSGIRREAEMPSPSIPTAKITTRDAAALVGVKTARRVGQLIATGDLRGEKVGRQWLIDKTSIDEFLARKATKR